MKLINIMVIQYRKIEVNGSISLNTDFILKEKSQNCAN